MLNLDLKHRRDDLTAKEWEELERVARLYWIKGTTRILDENYTITKDNNGKYQTRSNQAFGGKRGTSFYFVANNKIGRAHV